MVLSVVGVQPFLFSHDDDHDGDESGNHGGKKSKFNACAAALFVR